MIPWEERGRLTGQKKKESLVVRRVRSSLSLQTLVFLVDCCRAPLLRYFRCDYGAFDAAAGSADSPAAPLIHNLIAILSIFVPRACFLSAAPPRRRLPLVFARGSRRGGGLDCGGGTVVHVKGILRCALVTETSETFQTAEIDQLGLLANLQALISLSTDISEWSGRIKCVKRSSGGSMLTIIAVQPSLVLVLMWLMLFLRCLFVPVVVVLV